MVLDGGKGVGGGRGVGWGREPWRRVVAGRGEGMVAGGPTGGHSGERWCGRVWRSQAG